MKKDAYYFPHFCNARHDRKIKRIQKDLGLEGYGIFFMLLEVLREQTEFKYPYEDIDLLADEFGTSLAKVEVIVNNYGLFNFDETRMFYSPKLLEYLQPYFEKSDRAKKANEKRWSRHNEQKQLPENTNPNGIQMDNKWNTNGIQMEYKSNPSKVKESKEKESKVEVVDQTEQNHATAATASPFNSFQKNIGPLNPHILIKIQNILDTGITNELLCRYIETAVERGAGNWAYIESMAMGNLEQGIKTLDQYESMQNNRNTAPKKSKQELEMESWK